MARTVFGASKKGVVMVRWKVMGQSQGRRLETSACWDEDGFVSAWEETQEREFRGKLSRAEETEGSGNGKHRS